MKSAEIRLRLTNEEIAVFRFLDDLRESGATNMFGAGPYIEDAFGYSSKTARYLLTRWMETFSERHA